MKKKFIKLTNVANNHKGMPIWLNIDHISSIYEFPSEEGGSLRTCVYGGQTGVIWEVEESPFQIFKSIAEQQE
jgi:hypothetical protein